MKGYFLINDLMKGKLVKSFVKQKWTRGKTASIIGASGGTYLKNEYRHLFEKWVNKSPLSFYRVYAIYSFDGYTKIGIAKDIKKRVETLQVGNPHKLEIFAKGEMTSFAKKKELKLHLKYKKYHHRGEWFKMPPSLHLEIKIYIENLEV